MHLPESRRGLAVIAAAAAILAAFLSATAFADVTGMFETLDRNDDGWVSYDELSGQASMQQHFSEADLDGNALLSPLEFEQLFFMPGATPDPQ
jgi:hypothetical protein